MKFSFHRIYGLILRHYLQSKRSLTRILDTVFWPIIDLFLWGLTSKFIAENATGIPNIMLMIISGIIFWQMVYRNQNLITVSLLEDFWNKSFMHYFIAPMKFKEYILGIVSFAFIKVILTLIVSLILAFILYKFNIFIYGFYLIPLILNLILLGWWVGLFVFGMILRYGSKIEILAWSFVAIFSPFAAVYYPITILPNWARIIAYLFPGSYVFESAREILNTGYFDPSKFLMSLGLNLIFLVLALLYLRSSFKSILNKGLIKVF